MILQVLFKQGGRTIRETIANKFLHHDQSQIVFYSTAVRNMSGLVLSDRGIVEHDGKIYRLTEEFTYFNVSGWGRFYLSN